MLKILWNNLLGRSVAPSAEDALDDAPPSLQMAQSALFMRAAQIDGNVAPEERETLMRLMKKAFGLSEAECEKLIEMADAEAHEATDLFHWTKQINEEMGEDEKRLLIENLWEVVYADGECDDFESNLLRRVAGLLHVPDRSVAEIRQSVLSAKS